MDWRLLLSAFSLIFLAEIGDKTQLSVLTLSAQTGKPVPVFIGAALGLAASALGAALLGGVLNRIVPLQYIRYAAGLLFILFGVLILLDRV